MMIGTKGGSIAKKVTLSTGLNLAQQLVIVVGSVFVARRVGPEALGILAYAGAYVGIFQSLSDFGIGTAHVKRISEGQDPGQCMGMAWLAKIVGLIVMSLVVLISFWGGGYKSFNDQTGVVVFYLSIFTLVASQLAIVPITTLSAFQDVIRKDLPATATQLLNAGLRVSLAVLGLGAIGLAVADSTAAIVLLVVYLWLMRTLPVSWPSRIVAKGYLTFGVPIFVIAIVTSVGERLDRLFLEIFAGTTELGQYSAGMRLGSILNFLSAAVAGLVFPSMSRAYAEGRPNEAFDLCGRAVRRLALVLFPFMLAITPVARPAVSLLLGGKYLDTGQVVVLGTVAMIFQTLAQPYRQIIIGAEKLTVSVIGNVIFFAVQTSLLYLFIAHPLGLSIPIQGAPGAAAGMALAAAAGTIAWHGLAERSLGAALDKRVWLHVASATVLFVPAYIISFGPKELPIDVAVSLAAALASAQLLVLRLAGELGLEQFGFISSLVASFGLDLRLVKSTAGETL